MAMRRNQSKTWYHGSDQRLSELEGYEPGYSGSLGYGVYLTSDPSHARIYGRYIHVVKDHVPDHLVLWIEPMTWECGQDLVIGTSGSSPFSFDVKDRNTGEVFRYAVLDNCDQEVKGAVRADLASRYKPSHGLVQAMALMDEPSRECLRVVMGNMLSDLASGSVSDSRVAEEVGACVAEATGDDDKAEAAESLVYDIADELDSWLDVEVEKRIGIEISLDELSSTAKSHGYSAFYISNYAPSGDEYVVFDERFLPIPVLEVQEEE